MMPDTLDSLRTAADKANKALQEAETKLNGCRVAVLCAADELKDALTVWMNTPVPKPPAAKGKAKEPGPEVVIDTMRAELDKAIAEFTSIRRNLGV